MIASIFIGIGIGVVGGFLFLAWYIQPFGKR